MRDRDSTIRLGDGKKLKQKTEGCRYGVGMLEELKAVGSEKLLPEGSGTIKAWSRIGYDLHDALADLIDNSIDAEARRVEITIYRNDDEITSVTIADDGHGMDAARLRTGMQFGGRVDHAPNDLGVFGMGMKTASFSQCETLTVLTRQCNVTSAARWSVEQFDKDWSCELLDGEASEEQFRRLCIPSKRPVTGTLVVWDRLTRLAVGGNDEDLDTFLATAMSRIEVHLGMVFHRFLADGALGISITVRHELRTMAIPRMIRPLDPFDYETSAVEGWPKDLRTDLPGVGTLTLNAHIWPPGSLSDAYLMGERNAAPLQGFYFYRNNRIIQAGGWNGAIRDDQDSDLALARVIVELPPGGLGVNVQKSRLQVTAAQSQAFLKAHCGDITFDDYIAAARNAQLAARRAARAAKAVPLVPGQGLPMPLRKTAVKLLAGTGPHEEMDFTWEPLDDDEVFRLDLTETRIILNRSYRREILGDAPASSADAPLVKMLFFLLFKDDFERQRMSGKQSAYLQQCNALLLEAIGR